MATFFNENPFWKGVVTGVFVVLMLGVLVGSLFSVNPEGPIDGVFFASPDVEKGFEDGKRDFLQGKYHLKTQKEVEVGGKNWLDVRWYWVGYEEAQTWWDGYRDGVESVESRDESELNSPDSVAGTKPW